MVLDEGDGGTVKYQNGPGVDDKLSLKTGSDVKYFLADHLGSTVGLADAAGTVAAVQSYDAFGNGADAAFPTRYQFTGREFDRFTGLQYSRARWYHPGIGRFISEDPIGFKGRDINLYAYAKSNPVSFKDPSGKIWIYVIVGGVIAAEGGIHLYLGERARSINWPGGDPWGRTKHCYVNCMSTRIHLGGTGAATAAGLSQELVNWGQGAPIEDIAGDLRANFEGQRNAYMFWKSCEELCRTCR